MSWAEDAVRKSISSTEQEALKLKVIDMIAEDIPTLLKRLQGKKIAVPNGTITFSSETTTLHEFPMGTRLELLKILSDPNIAYLLMSIGTIGIMAELYSPGAILPGIIGAISLILAFYSLQSLPVNYAGAFLVILSTVFLLLEISVTSYGLLALGGLAAMTLGGLFLIKSDAPFLQVSLSFLLPTVMTIGGLIGIIAWTAVKSAASQTNHWGGRDDWFNRNRQDRCQPQRSDYGPRRDLGGGQPNSDSTGGGRGGMSVEGLTVKVAPLHR